MQKTAFLFPGQGSQSVGMMAGLAEQSPIVKETFDAASAVLGYDLFDLAQNGPPERLNKTELTQPAMLTAGVATWRIWKANGGFDPDYMAGHSLGEYAALVAAGSMDFEDAVAVADERGRDMQAATPPGSGKMAAILGLDDDVLIGVCEEAAQGQVVSCANFNSPGQVVIAGNEAAVDRAIELAVAAGARHALPLPVSVASHCELMRPSAEAMQKKLEAVALSKARIPVIHNVDVRTHQDADEIRDLLVRQMWAPVRWSETVQLLIKNGVSHFAECGPGKVLTGLNRRISREISSVALISHEAIIETLENWS
ncbi:MAG: ACP S-malonyltransferase [Gammaproteobacteria bacterium]|jgi:[acyl-carrier-protein] S-malonyltransferase|nr:ACP S-malonyltransferase [Gammaproteobacteria bacterium]